MSTARFRIAFSFAGEKRDFVEKVAGILAVRFGKDAILYDKYHEAEFARHDLGIYLPKLYGKQSDLIVPVLCPNYDAKRWTGWEWLHIYGMLTKEDGHRVMPSRFEYAEADGLSPAAGFIELDTKTPEQFASLILERLALNEGKSRDFYQLPASVPSSRTFSNLPGIYSGSLFLGRDDFLRDLRASLLKKPTPPPSPTKRPPRASPGLVASARHMRQSNMPAGIRPTTPLPSSSVGIHRSGSTPGSLRSSTCCGSAAQLRRSPSRRRVSPQ